MNSKNSLSHSDNNQENSLSLETQGDIVFSNSTEKKELPMSLKTLIASVLLSSSLLLAGEAYARPNMTDEELAKAKETAGQLKPPLDLDALFDEADRLGVICEGDLSDRVILKTCKLKVERAQIAENTTILQAQNKEKEAELMKEFDALIQKTNEKLNQ